MTHDVLPFDPTDGDSIERYILSETVRLVRESPEYRAAEAAERDEVRRILHGDPEAKGRPLGILSARARAFR